MLQILNDSINNSSLKIQKLINDFIDETKNELWDSEEDLLKHYRIDKNYLKLKNGEVGGNLIYKYKSKNLVENSLDWLKFFEDELFKAITIKHANISGIDETDHN